jgi:uncharacterized phage protein (TIGR01671 family)
MREIKFRAWDDNMKVMVNPYCELRDGNFWGEDCTNTGISVAHEHVMQYTGLKDKEGREIYEGDIVRTYMGTVCEIRWDFVSEKTKSFDYEYTGFCFHHIKQKRNYHLDVTSSCEIIGNIYENPELLKDTAQAAHG